MTKLDGKIFILNVNPLIALSQKSLLEGSDLGIELHGLEADDDNYVFDSQDIVIIDIEPDQDQGFVVLDALLRAKQSPKILVTIYNDQIFQADDRLGLVESCVLFKPYSPREMIAAIERLSFS